MGRSNVHSNLHGVVRPSGVAAGSCSCPESSLVAATAGSLAFPMESEASPEEVGEGGGWSSWCLGIFLVLREVRGDCSSVILCLRSSVRWSSLGRDWSGWASDSVACGNSTCAASLVVLVGVLWPGRVGGSVASWWGRSAGVLFRGSVDLSAVEHAEVLLPLLFDEGIPRVSPSEALALDFNSSGSASARSWSRLFSCRGGGVGDRFSEFCFWVGDPEGRLGPGSLCILSAGVSILLGSRESDGPLSAEVPSLDRSKDGANEDDIPSVF
jgi:hypothetical protein